MTVRLFSPAKINLSLAVTGRRADGFHELVSVVAPLAWGDTLTAEAGPDESGECALRCDDPALPVDESNLVIKAVRAFRAATGWRRAVSFRLEKRIPVGAGLGGGSSNGATALRALNELAGERLGAAALSELAAELGSDCPLFLHDGPVVMRGRGERIEALPEAARTRLSGRRVLVFKPAFAVSTPWAYRRLATLAQAEGEAGGYVAAERAEAALAAWVTDEMAPAERLTGNSLERAVFEKFLALPVLLEAMAARFGVTARMSGSGSACFALLPEGAAVEEMRAAVREAWGESAWIVETAIG